MKPLYETDIGDYRVAYYEEISPGVMVSPLDKTTPGWWNKVQRYKVYNHKELLNLEPTKNDVIYNLFVYKDCMIVGRDRREEDDKPTYYGDDDGRKAMLTVMAQWFPYKSIAEYRRYNGYKRDAWFPIVQRRRYRDDEHRKVKTALAHLGFTVFHKSDDKYLVVYEKAMTLDEIGKAFTNVCKNRIAEALADAAND